MKKFILLALMPLFLFACVQRTTVTKTTTTDPNTGQQTTTTTTTVDDGGINNQSYQVYNGPNGQQFAVTYINGQQMYVPYNIFQQQMALGGYNALNDYYYTNGSYFRPYSSSSFATGFILATALSGSYGNYYTRNNIRSYNSYRPVHQPMYRQATMGSNSQAGRPAQSINQSGMGNRQVAQPQRPINQPSTSGMGQRPQAQPVYKAAVQTSSGHSSGMGGRSSSTRSSGMGKRR